ncbi:hypothetical protein GGF50DRAFT_92673 [Schizophyllum commune]
MTQINTPVLPPGLAGLTPEQLQVLVAFFSQNQNTVAQSQSASTNPTYSSSSSTVHSPPGHGAGTVQSPPPTPRTPANGKASLSTSAAQTPSSKLAQMSLKGEKATPPQKGRGRKSTARKAQPKAQLPTGYDPALTYEAVQPGQSRQPEPTPKPQQEDSDPFEGFPEIVTAPPKVADSIDKMDVDVPKPSVGRRKRNDSECSPPPVKRSPKKKARVASPTPQPASSVPTGAVETAVPAHEGSVEQPSKVNSMEIQILEALLARARQGEKISLGSVLNKSVSRDFVDDEAEERSAGDDDDEEEEEDDLHGFVVPDDVVEYDADAPALPDDDDDIPLSRNSDIEIVPTVDKGKRRADPEPSPPPSRDAHPDDLVSSDGPSRATGDASASAAASGGSGHDSDSSSATEASGLDGVHDASTIFSWTPHRNEFLDAIDFCSDAKPVPGDCALTLSDFNDDGWSMPSIEVVAAAETHVHVSNLKKGLKFRRAGPFINEATIDPSEIVAAQVSGPGSTLRYKFICKDTRAPAVSITPCIIRYTRLDAPSNGNPPLRYISVSPFDGLFDRMVGLECMKFGQREMQCVSFNNAIRIATVPAFERPLPTPSSSKAKTSSSIRRGNNSGQTSRRASNFEPSTNDSVAVYDARAVKLPMDISTWTSALPLLDGPIPKDAVAFVAHTTNMWVGTRSKTAPTATTHNVQHNIIFVVVIGALPHGFV